MVLDLKRCRQQFPFCLFEVAKTPDIQREINEVLQRHGKEIRIGI